MQWAVLAIACVHVSMHTQHQNACKQKPSPYPMHAMQRAKQVDAYVEITSASHVTSCAFIRVERQMHGRYDHMCMHEHGLALVPQPGV